MSGGCLAGVLRVYGGCLKGSGGYVMCLDLSEGQDRTSQVRTGQDRCLEGV